MKPRVSTKGVRQAGRVIALMMLGAFLGAGACLADAAVRNPWMGVSTHFVRKKGMEHWNPAKFLPMVDQLGVGWIRDEILWSQIERSKGDYAIPDNALEWIIPARERGLKIVLTIAGGNNLYEDFYDADAYANAAAFAAVALKGKVDVLEILNEPFQRYASFYGGGTTKGGDWYGLSTKTDEVQPYVDRYRMLLNTAADAIKSANPDMKVIGLGSFPGINYRQIEWGLSSNVDGITAHPYSYRTVPEVVPYAANERNFKRNGGRDVADSSGSFASFIEKYREFLKAHNGPKEIWLTEWGYTTYIENPKSRSNYRGFNDYAVAAYSLRRFMQCMGLGVELSVQYGLVDDNYNSDNPVRAALNGENHFGLLYKDGQPKPVYYAVQRLAHETADLKPASDVRVQVEKLSSRPDPRPADWWDGTTLSAPDDIACYAFRDAKGSPVVALWSMERVDDQSARAVNVSIDLPAGTDVEVVDLMTGRHFTPGVEEHDEKLFLPNLGAPPYPILLRLGGE